MLLWADEAGKVTCWDPASQQVRHSPTLPLQPLVAIAASDDLRWLAASGGRGELLLWDLDRSRLVWQQTLPGGMARHLRFDAEGAVLHAAREDGQQTDWAVADGRPLARWQAPASPLACLGLVRAGAPLHAEALAEGGILLA